MTSINSRVDEPSTQIDDFDEFFGEMALGEAQPHEDVPAADKSRDVVPLDRKRSNSRLSIAKAFSVEVGSLEGNLNNKKAEQEVVYEPQIRKDFQAAVLQIIDLKNDNAKLSGMV